MVTLDAKTREQLARRTISEIVDQTGDTEVSLPGTQGPRLTVNVGRDEKVEHSQLSIQDVINMQLEASLIDRFDIEMCY